MDGSNRPITKQHPSTAGRTPGSDRMSLPCAYLWDRMMHKERLAQAGVMAAGILHDTRTLMAVVEGYCSLALREMPAGPAARMLQRARESAASASETFHALASFSEPSAPRARRCDVSKVLRDAQRFLATAIREGGADLSVSCPAGLHAWFHDQVLLQATTNLVLNAVEACGAKRTASRGRVRLVARATDTCVEIRITDDGPGIPARIRAQLFQPFASARRAERGTGLGLFITRELVERLGGRVACEATGPTGTTFRLRLPRLPTSARP